MTNNNIIILDTETTSLEDDRKIIQLAYEYNGNIFEEKYNTGGYPISIGAMAIHHITNNDIKDKETFEESRDKNTLQELLINNILVAHNAMFDIDTIKNHGVKTYKYIDTLKVARYLWPELEQHKQQYLRYALNLEFEQEINPHDAKDDIIVLKKIFEKMVELFIKEYGNIDIVYERMIQISGKPSLLHKCNFGKHRGELWSDIPEDYLNRILNISDIDDESKLYTAKYYIEHINNNDDSGKQINNNIIYSDEELYNKQLNKNITVDQNSNKLDISDGDQSPDECHASNNEYYRISDQGKLLDDFDEDGNEIDGDGYIPSDWY